ncbi:hypothetical protein Slala01_15650 [Streptomyces lavendulae subsp. lavendulae]|nr:hypothetical protein Slala01_15650 [Streptomyces lavendulae subsp. lavendulae]
MRDSHRVEAERVLARAVEEEVRRAGAGDAGALLARGREALDGIAAAAAEEYAAYVAALDEAAAGEQSLGEAFRRGNTGASLFVTGVAAAAAVGADLAFGVDAGTALSAGIVVGVAGAAATVAKVTALHVPAANRRAGAAGRPGGAEQLRLQWLTALEVRGIRPFLEQERAVAAAAVRGPVRGRVANGASVAAGGGVAPLRGGDRSAEARRRSMLEQSFGQLPDADALFTGRRAELTRIAQWVSAARASTETRPVVVVLHGEPGVGRTALALRAAHALRDQFRGACVVDLRGGATGAGEAPLSTREALLHLLNRLGAPRDQLLFREGASAESQVRRLTELYHQHLQGFPVTVVLDDAVDAGQVRTLVPERTESLVLVTAREPLELPADLGAWVHQLPVVRLAQEESAEVLRGGARAAGEAAPEGAALDGLLELGAGLPLALRVLAPLGSARASDGGGGGGLEHALELAYVRLPEERRRLLRRLTLAGRASLGAAAAAALAGADRVEAGRLLGELARAGLLDLVRGERYRVHDAVRSYAAARLAADEDRAQAAAAHERLIRDYAQLADSVIRMVDGKMSTRANHFGGHGFSSLDAALRWLDEESSFITAALRHSEGVDQQAVLDLLGALCDFCLLRGDRADAGGGPGAAEPFGAVAYGHRGAAAGRAGQVAHDADVAGGPVPGGAAGGGRGDGAGVAGDHAAPPGQPAGGGGADPGGAGAAGAGGACGRPGVGAARAGGGGAGPGAAGRGGGAAGAVAGAAPGERERARGGVGALPAGAGVPADGRGGAGGGGAAAGAGPVRADAGRPGRGVGADAAGAGPGGGR